jgi:hypothetical protein
MPCGKVIGSIKALALRVLKSSIATKKRFLALWVVTTLFLVSLYAFFDFGPLAKNKRAPSIFYLEPGFILLGPTGPFSEKNWGKIKGEAPGGLKEALKERLIKAPKTERIYKLGLGLNLKPQIALKSKPKVQDKALIYLDDLQEQKAQATLEEWFGFREPRKSIIEESRPSDSIKGPSNKRGSVGATIKSLSIDSSLALERKSSLKSQKAPVRSKKKSEFKAKPKAGPKFKPKALANKVKTKDKLPVNPKAKPRIERATKVGSDLSLKPSPNLITWDCLNKAAKKSGIEPALILLILETEGGVVGLSSKNKNGSFDLGPMQINQLWLKSLKKDLGLSEREIRDNGCHNIAAGAHILSLVLKQRGSVKSAIAGYHSLNPKRGQKYLAIALEKAKRLNVSATLKRANGLTIVRSSKIINRREGHRVNEVSVHKGERLRARSQERTLK